MGCGSDETRRATTTPGGARPALDLYAYDREAPLGFRDHGRANRRYPIVIRDVSFAGAKGGRVTGYLAVPPVDGRKPAVIYVHGAGGTRADFLVQSTWMAARGAITLTIDAAFSRLPRRSLGDPLARVRRDRDVTVRTIVELRRAIDLLQARRDVDPKRIAYFGWSAGARMGAILAGVERRIVAYELIGGGAEPVSRYVRAAPPRLRGTLTRILEAIDPLRYVSHAAPATLLLQYGLDDDVVPREALDRLSRAASEPKSIGWYDAGHEPSPEQFVDGLRFLSDALGLDGVVVRGVRTGP